MQRTQAIWLAIGLTLGLGLGSAVATAADGADIIYEKLEILAQVLGHIENNYVDAVTATELIYGAAKGAVRVLDEHSSFFTPDEYKDLLEMTEGEFPGIGIELSWDEELPEVMTVLPGSAAFRAGVLAGDKIQAIDGVSLAGTSLDLVQQKLRGPVGSKIVLTVRRQGREAPWSFTLVRSWLRIAPVEHKQLFGGIEYAHVKTFSRRVSTDLAASIPHDKGPRGLVLDLRQNPGGLFDEAVAMCDLFLKDGPIVSAIGKGGRVIERHEAHPHGTEPDYPLAILIDGGSASAAEVVAGALADRGRAKLFGQKSYGKGSVQSILDLPDGSGLKLTVARYVTPGGRQIDKHGIVPDVVIEAATDDRHDPTIDAAVAWILSAK